jgi:predicted nucleotidyltransferase
MLNVGWNYVVQLWLNEYCSMFCFRADMCSIKCLKSYLLNATMYSNISIGIYSISKKEVGFQEKETQYGTRGSASSRRNSRSNERQRISNEDMSKDLQSEIDRLRAETGMRSKYNREER